MYDWTLDAASAAPATAITASGSAGTRNLLDTDAGKVLWLTVKAKDVNAVAGNLVAVSTAMSDGVGTCPAEGDCTGITNPPDSGGAVETGKPSVEKVKISGTDLNVGTTLTGSYVYAPNGAGADASVYDWTLDAASAAPATAITASGSAGTRNLLDTDAGKVLWLTVKAKDVNAVAGNLVAVSTAMSDGVGTCPAEGDCTGITNPPDSGGVVETGKPSVEKVKISGTDLNVGTTLTGSYVYAQNGAGADASVYDWTLDAASAAPATAITGSGNAGTRTLLETDAGKVLWLTVKAKDVNAVAGNLVAVSTAMSDGVGTCPAEGDCTGITNPPDSGGVVETGKPSVEKVKISGTDLNVGTTLTGSYVYAQNGAGADASVYDWTLDAASAAPATAITASGMRALARCWRQTPVRCCG
ncbi:hypothetical protein EXW94_27325 [Enterobacter sp. JMULE2]|uniref:hypothetical protein n=1 Tax=Enterobacter sp. JMULE2 TaxID=2518340 RepID=UPI0015774C59|nr:hypothetical protein [Enterobacter sp. JMULE2]NTZ41307.1 hypothetical protein [Enterobacter sp. JMULE2]